jgi:hypothetical protein
VNHAAPQANAGAHHERAFRIFARARKEKPGGGNAGSDLVVIGVYGFKYAAWLLLVAPEGAARLIVIVQPTFCSCSSTFLFFSKVSKFNRTLCDFASISVRLRTHSSLGGDDQIKQDICHSTKDQQIQSDTARKSLAALGLELVL